LGEITASPTFSLSQREEAVLQYKAKRYIYYINFISLFTTFGSFFSISFSEKQGLCVGGFPFRGKSEGGRIFKKQRPMCLFLSPPEFIEGLRG